MILPIDLQEIKNNVRAPTENKDRNDNKGHLNGLDFGFRYQASGRGSAGLEIMAFFGLGFHLNYRATRRGADSLFAALIAGLDFPAFVPNGADDDDVTAGDEDGGDDKERHGDKCHVELPLPLLFKVNPALGPVVLGLCRVVEVEDGRGKCSAEDPGDYD